MTQATLQNAPDLRTGYPRSPNELLGDYILVGRILDKCRATLAGKNGEYNYNCPLDQRFFIFTGIDPEAFQAQVAQGKSDEEMLSWVQQNSKPRTQDEILTWAYETRVEAPEMPEKKAYFERTRRAVAPTHWTLRTWFELLDAEEGRL